MGPFRPAACGDGRPLRWTFRRVPTGLARVVPKSRVGPKSPRSPPGKNDASPRSLAARLGRASRRRFAALDLRGAPALPAPAPSRVWRRPARTRNGIPPATACWGAGGCAAGDTERWGGVGWGGGGGWSCCSDAPPAPRLKRLRRRRRRCGRGRDDVSGAAGGGTNS
jgi:hypothetical protein